MQEARVRHFDFDSLAPVQGNVIDEKYEQAITRFWHWSIGYVLAFDVVAAGAWIGKWWYFGGFRWMAILIHKFGGGFLTMVEHGF